MLGRFIKHIREGLETDIVELKAFPLPLGNDNSFMENTIKEILAIANTGRQGFILFGVNDATNRKDGKEAVPGIVNTRSDDQIQREFSQKLAMFTQPPVRVRYTSYSFGEKKIGVLTVLRSRERPHMVARDGSPKLRRGTYFIRQGTSTEMMTPDQMHKIMQEPTKRYITLLNFTHPFQETQIRQLEAKLNCFVEHIWPDCKIDLNPSDPFEPQIRKIVDDLGYTSEEWQDVSRFVVSLPGFSEAAAVLLAELHGRMGQFPSVVRRCQIQQNGLSEYAVAEVVNLSEVRARARREGAHVVSM